MKDIIIHYSIGLKDYYRAHMGDPLIHFVGFILFLAGAIAVFFLYQVSGAIILLIFCVAAAIVLLLYTLSIVCLVLIWMFKYRKKSQTYMAFTEYGIFVQNSKREEWISWTDVGNCEDKDHSFIILYKQSKVLVISKDVLLKNHAFIFFKNLLKKNNIRASKEIAEY